ncbi:MAG: histidinol-phosphate transaminase [Rhodospirillaceae bacterium]|nr:histidinol-phosphate transaminase [Rhodospirillaceae bacterium]|tara:strand:- start:1942 stop:3051 length:1110 start_codon:yes stop_codon:yes gene_type:complete
MNKKNSFRHIEPKPGISSIEPYKGGNHNFSDANIINLASNESFVGPSPRVIKSLNSFSHSINRYPDGSTLFLRRAISEKYNIDVDRIACGCGSDELIDILVRCFSGPSDEVLFSQYGFLMYSIAAKSNGSIPIAAPEYNFKTDVHSILSSISDNTKVILIANPNNPTGSYLNKIELELLCREVPKNILLVIDSAYAEFVTDEDYESGIMFVNNFDNVVMTRTFSKLYGLASLRLGWSYSSKYISEIIDKVRQPFNVNSLAQVAGIEALGDLEHENFIITKNKENLSKLRNGIECLGFQVMPSVANFVLVKFENSNYSTSMHDFLISRKVLVRKVAAYGLPDYLRITVGKKEEIDLLLQAMQDFKSIYNG